ncbi:IS30 family transposase [Shewanella abyssi]|uniref:IS30 family transposase n=1 Tax=Shewanella abyssi TaxID=311789 RepID=UPI002010ACA1|nr:IS30 family transposase [Shewanella abyssi]MCL1049209.1 IS30 family transposase [Shewanella abyssi]
MTYNHLSMYERKAIYYRFNSGESLRSIGRFIGRHHTTISREISRNKPLTYTYFDNAAQEKALARRQIPRHQKKYSNIKLRTTVITLLKRGWSPATISGRLKLEHPDDPLFHVSHEAIYQWVIKDFKHSGNLYCYLAKRHKNRRKQRKYGDLRGQIKGRISIHDRPQVVDTRSRIGDWEGDLVEGKKGSGYFVTHLERKSRYLIAKKIDDKKAASFNRVSIEAFQALPEAKRLTLTLDNGKEFSAFKELESAVGIDIYFADPYSSWQRGANEHANGLLGRYFPKGTDFSAVTSEQLETIVNLINNRPRKILNYQTPAEVFR